MELSIIIPVFNVENYLEKCLISVFKQDLDSFEVICINDGSTDLSKKILDKYQNRYKDLIIINQENHGLSHARNQGIKKAKGKFIIFLDSDDFWFEGKIKPILNIAKEKELDILGFNTVYSNYKLHYTFDRHYDNQILKGVEYLEIKGLEIPLTAWSYIINKKVIEKNNLSFKEGVFFEDFLFVNQILIHSAKVLFLSYEIVSFYLMNANSISRRRDFKTIKDFHDNLLDLYNYYSENGILTDSIKIRIINSFFYNTERAIEFRYYEEYNKYISNSSTVLRNCVKKPNHQKLLRIILLDVRLYKIYFENNWNSKLFRLIYKL